MDEYVGPGTWIVIEPNTKRGDGVVIDGEAHLVFRVRDGKVRTYCDEQRRYRDPTPAREAVIPICQRCQSLHRWMEQPHIRSVVEEAVERTMSNFRRWGIDDASSLIVDGEDG